MKKIDFVFLWSQNDWGFYRRRNESLALALADREECGSVYHLEPLDLKALVRLIAGYLFEKNPKLRAAYGFHFRKWLSPRPLSAANRVRVKSIFCLSAARRGPLHRINAWMLKNQLGWYRESLRDDSSLKVLMIYPHSAHAANILEVLPGDCRIADLVDDAMVRTKSRVTRRRIEENYRDILPKADHIFATEAAMKKYEAVAGKEIDVLPNGVWPQEFSLVLQAPEEGPAKDRLSAGYVSRIDKSLDVDLAEFIVRENAGIDFIFAGNALGPGRRFLRRLQRYPNFRYLGGIHYSEVPPCLARMDVLLNLKKNDASSQGGESMKTYEYLATGKPVVSTSVPPAGRFRHLIYVSDKKEEFHKLLGQALRENDPKLRDERIKEARRNSWVVRADRILALIKDFFPPSD